jgi:hypothetical protein
MPAGTYYYFMVFSTDNRPRPALLSLIMLAVLVLSVAAAWLVAFPRQSAYRHAVDILRSFNARELNSYWSSHQETWFVAHDASGAIGWKSTFLQRSGNSFVGDTIARRSQLFRGEHWDISDDLKTIDYRATFPDFSYKVLQHEETIKVEFPVRLPNGTVRWVPLPPDGQGERVENYLPPCLIEQAVAHVAKTQQAATFAIVDGAPFAAHQPAMRTLNLAITPIGPHTVQTTAQGDTAITTIYILADDGSVSEIQDRQNRITYKRTTRENVEKQYPHERLPEFSASLTAPKEELSADGTGESD